MNAPHVLQSESTTTALALIVSGLISLVVRRHVILNLLGVSLAILGAALLIVDMSPTKNRWTAAILVVSASLLAPIGMIAAARWRMLRGSASQATLRESDEDDARV